MLSAIYVPVAQLDRVLDYESRGRGFESLLARQRKKVPYGAFFVWYGINRKDSKFMPRPQGDKG